MRAILAACMVTVAFAQQTSEPASVGYDCGLDLVTRWNAFAKDANAYIALLKIGVVDRKAAQRVENEAKNVFRCECWK